MQNGNQTRRRRESEDGFLLIAVIFMIFLLTIGLSVAIPSITKSLQRDKEVETMHRGKQYIRAIQLYYRKFGSYPPSIDALVKTNNIRFLRKRYLDPLTGKDDWKPIYFGQNKAPLAMGFFGQPLGGLTGSGPIAGTGPSGGNTMPGAGLGGQNGSSFGAAGGGIFGGSPGMGGTQSPGAGSNGPAGVADATGNSAGGSDQGGGSSAGGASGSGTGFMSGQNGQTFGGGGIIGVEPPVDKKSILIYKKMDHYNKWEFTYSPLQDQMQQAGAMGMGGTPNTGLNGSGSGTDTNGTGSSPFGGGPGMGSGSSGGSPFGGSFGGNSGGGNSGGSSFGGTSSPSPSPQQPQ